MAKKVEKQVKEAKTEEVVEETEKIDVKKSDLKKDKKEKKEFNAIKFIWNAFFWTAFVIFVAMAVGAFVNYNKIEKNEEPFFYFDKEEYKTDSGANVTVYDYFVYKIVEEYEGTASVSLKLWFLPDIAE